MNQQHQHQSAGCLKGIVHLKMKILSSFTHPQVFPNLYECLCSTEHNGIYSEECGKQSSSGALLTSIIYIFFHTMEVNGAAKQPVTNFLFRIYFFVFSRINKQIQVWNYMKVSKWWQNFNYWVNYPFNHTSLYFNINWIEPRMILKVFRFRNSDWQISLFFCWRWQLSNSVVLLRVPPSGLGVNCLYSL